MTHMIAADNRHRALLDVDPVLDGLFTPMHLIIILVIAPIVLGPKRLPETGRSLGAAIRGFKDSLSEAAPIVHTADTRWPEGAGAPSGGRATGRAGASAGRP
jgi:sec-independent protein translocase protein TatA